MLDAECRDGGRGGNWRDPKRKPRIAARQFSGVAKTVPIR